MIEHAIDIDFLLYTRYHAKDCDTSYIGETGRDLHKRIVEHKAAVRRKDDKNGIATMKIRTDLCLC